MAVLQITLTLNVKSDREIHFPLIFSYWLLKQWQLLLEKMLKLQEETKLFQFADDTNSALVLFKLQESFQHLSGLKVNSSKTEGLWIGSLKNNQIKPFGIKWPEEPIKAFGVFFTYNQKLL